MMWFDDDGVLPRRMDQESIVLMTLWHDVLKQGIRDAVYALKIESEGKEGSELAPDLKDDLAWFYSNSTAGPRVTYEETTTGTVKHANGATFGWLCELFGLPPEKVRQHVLANRRMILREDKELEGKQ